MIHYSDVHFIILFCFENNCFNLYLILKIFIELVKKNENEANPIQSLFLRHDLFLLQKLVWENLEAFSTSFIWQIPRKIIRYFYFIFMCIEFWTGLPSLQIQLQCRWAVFARSIHGIWKQQAYYGCTT